MPRSKRRTDELSRRERQIMDIIYELGEATVADVRSRLPDPPSYSTARALLAKLETKGHVRHSERDLRYVYAPIVSRQRARDGAIARLIRVFFGGSLPQAVEGMLDMSVDQMNDEDLDRLAATIEGARRRRGQR